MNDWVSGPESGGPGYDPVSIQGANWAKNVSKTVKILILGCFSNWISRNL